MSANYRLDHLENYIKRTFQNIGLDEISRQMERHDVSAKYTADRVLEMFETILIREKETLINECQLNIKTAKNERARMQAALEEEQAASEQELKACCNENLRRRRELNALETALYGNDWKLQRKMYTTNSKLNNMQERLNAQLTHVAKIQRVSQDLCDLLESSRSQIDNMMHSFADSMSEIRTSAQALINKEREKLSRSSIVQRYESDLEVQKRITSLTRKSIADLMSHINNLDKENPILLTFDEMSTPILQKAIESASKFAKSANGYLPGSDAPERVEAKLYEMVKKKEDEYIPLLMKQKRSMERLQKELKAAQKRLNALIESDSFVDPALMTILDKAKKEMVTTQARTDEVMQRLQEKSYSSFDSSFL